jgi:hypothetical protein
MWFWRNRASAADRQRLIVQKGKPFLFLIKRSFEKVYHPTIFRRVRRE